MRSAAGWRPSPASRRHRRDCRPMQMSEGNPAGLTFVSTDPISFTSRCRSETAIRCFGVAEQGEILPEAQADRVQARTPHVR